MKKLNLAYFTELGERIAPLAKLPDYQDFKPDPFRLLCIRAEQILAGFPTEDSIPLVIPASRPALAALLQAVKPLGASQNPTVGDAWNVYWLADKAWGMLQGELSVQAVYHIWPKRAYDTGMLIDRATRLFSEEVRKWLITEECYNIEQAGKCLAFEVPTAAAFHLMRAAESVIRRYYALVVGALPKPKARNWGAYIKNLNVAGADQKVMFALEQIKELHRNPIIHPEATVSLEEALSLLGLIDSVISAIHADMKKRQEMLAPALPITGGLLASTLLGLAQAANAPDAAE